MDDMLRELREIRDQIRRDHDPERLKKALREVVATPPRGVGARLTGYAAAAEPPLGLKQVLARPATDGRVAELQRLNDRVYLASALLRCDPRRLKSYGELAALGGELRKALNTIDNEEFVPDGFSAALTEEIRLQRRLPSLFEAVRIPRSPLRWPVEGAIGLPYLISEPSHDTAEKVPTRDPGTREVTFSARTMGVRVPFSHEFDEDSIVAAEDFVRRQIAKSLIDGLETALLNGDTDPTHMDATVTAANDVRRIFKGLRRLARDPAEATEHDVTSGGGGFGQAAVVAVRERLGAHGIDPRDLALIVSVNTYYRVIGDSASFGDFQTLDKVGPQAINLTGEVGALYGVPVIVSAYLPETCVGPTDSGAGTEAVFVLVNRRAYALATQVEATLETVWDPEALQFRVVGYQRVDFRPWFDSAEVRTVAVGYGLDLS